MDVLLIMFIAIVIAAVILQILLYRDKSTNGTIFILNLVLILVISFITFTGLPTNYGIQRVIAVAWSVLGIIAFFLKSKGANSISTSKILLTVAMVGGLIQMIFI